MPENTNPEIVEAIAEALEEGLDGVVEGAQDDITSYLNLLATQTAAAAAVGDQVSLDSLKRQAVLLAEKNRIRVQEAGWDTFNRIVGAVARVAVTALAA
jgi:hypothetical protein